MEAKWTSKDQIENENRQYLQPLMSDTATDGFIGTAIKSCIHKHPTHLDQRLLRPPELQTSNFKLQTKTAFTFGGLRGL
jgi:hypothetical protein